MISYNGIELGPILKEDADLLKAVINMTAPKVAVEFGFLRGHSAREILSALDSEARLISYDPTMPSNLTDSRFTFMPKSQTDYEPVEEGVDFVFLDASHELKLNQITFKKLVKNLNPFAIIAVHDTGKWFANVFNFHRGYEHDGGYLHCPEEREFVNWIKKEYPEFQQIHLNTQRKISHGITLLQKYEKLSN